MPVYELTDADVKPVSVSPIDPPVETPAATPAPPESQPAPSAPAVEPEEPEETPPEEPAEPAAPAPEAEPAQEPATPDDPELLRAIDKVYGPKLRELPEAKEAREREVQAGVDRALAEYRQQPAAHEDVIVHRTQAQRDLDTLSRVVQDAQEQGTVPDPQTVAGLAARHGYLAARAERFGAFEAAKAIVEHVTGPALRELEAAVGAEKYREARAPIDALYNDGVTQFRRFINAGTQSGRLTPADLQAHERALGEFVSRAVTAAVELGRKVGAAQTEKDARDTYEAKLRLERSNVLNQARAEVQSGKPVAPLTPTPEATSTEVQLGVKTLSLSAFDGSAIRQFERAAGRGK